MIDWLFYQQYHFADASCSQGRNIFVIYDGDGISEWYEIIIFSWKVVNVYLLTDRNCVSKSAVILEFLYLLLTAWVEFSSDWYRLFEESRYIYIDKGPLKPKHLIGGTKCYWLKWDNDWLGAWANRPVNPLNLREDTSCFSLKWKNHWWGLEHE